MANKHAKKDKDAEPKAPCMYCGKYFSLSDRIKHEKECPKPPKNKNSQAKLK